VHFDGVRAAFPRGVLDAAATASYPLPYIPVLLLTLYTSKKKKNK
jgi:hypothetical protein